MTESPVLDFINQLLLLFIYYLLLLLFANPKRHSSWIEWCWKFQLETGRRRQEDDVTTKNWRVSSCWVYVCISIKYIYIYPQNHNTLEKWSILKPKEFI